MAKRTKIRSVDNGFKYDQGHCIHQSSYQQYRYDSEGRVNH